MSTNQTDRELLELAAKARIGELAVAEHAAWVARNDARSALRDRMRDAELQFLQQIAREDWEADEWAEWDALLKAEKAAQMRLNTRRAATRRAIVRAAAEIGKATQ